MREFGLGIYDLPYAKVQEFRRLLIIENEVGHPRKPPGKEDALEALGKKRKRMKNRG